MQMMSNVTREQLNIAKLPTAFFSAVVVVGGVINGIIYFVCNKDLYICVGLVDTLLSQSKQMCASNEM